LYCRIGNRDGVARHGRYIARQWRVMEFAKAEAAHLAIPYTHAEIAVETSRQRATLEKGRERLGWAVADGLLSREQAKAKAVAIDAELASLDNRESMVEIPELDWSAPAAQVNEVLRALWVYIELDEQMRPVKAQWRVPEWRS
jgi:hypothetical protein